MGAQPASMPRRPRLLRWALMVSAVLPFVVGSAQARTRFDAATELPPALEAAVMQHDQALAPERIERIAVYGSGTVYVVVERAQTAQITSTYELSGGTWRLVHRHVDPVRRSLAGTGDRTPRCTQASRASSANEASQCSPM